ncbi:hypothetical protein C8D88_118109 [Lentzea atacamensis]|uniref:DUF4232 domain-containing protein n=1 Tax=Lentzea atacamensis TaxID=531938 RepID=A0A316I1R4_9PSEU|nr:hypothetical protein [Lentzea atacamensis]PWK81341.1 hypothetical protein C8D88_118109 [Lentzea atacamensis]
MKKPGLWRAVTTAALAGAAVLTAVVPAGADVRPTRPCAAGEISAEIGEGRSPNPSTSRLFTISLKGVSCLLSGALDYIRFYDTSGRPMDVRFSDKFAVAPFENVWVDDFRRPVVYVSAPAGNGGMPIGSMTFSVPTAPESELTAAWPAPAGGPLMLTKIMRPVS